MLHPSQIPVIVLKSPLLQQILRQSPDDKQGRIFYWWTRFILDKTLKKILIYFCKMTTITCIRRFLRAQLYFWWISEPNYFFSEKPTPLDYQIGAAYFRTQRDWQSNVELLSFFGSSQLTMGWGRRDEAHNFTCQCLLLLYVINFFIIIIIQYCFVIWH